MAVYHEPVMLEETLRYLDPKPGGVYVDCTVGGGGHAKAILSAIQPGGRLIGIDQDEEAIREAQRVLAPFGESVILVRNNFANLRAVLASLDIEGMDGVLFDLGVSGHQLETPERGFSFRYDAPLDMRMSRSLPQTAADLVNSLPADALAKLLWELGEERWARRIAEFIVRYRSEKPIETTGELAEIVKAAIPRSAWPPKIHPATRTYQALRIAVNQELETLEKALQEAIELLNPGARIVVITYHSLEDRITKRLFVQYAGKCRCPPELPVCVCGAEKVLKLLTRKPITPTPAEIERNPRARSAKLRAAEKLAAGG